MSRKQTTSVIKPIKPAKKVTLHTNKGAVFGTTHVYNDTTGAKYNSFKRIPYAKIPTGGLRFSDPEDFESYDHAVDVNNIEDVLYLNVFTPQVKKSSDEEDGASLRPVIAFVPGHLPLNNYRFEDFYGPHFLMEEDAVLVIISYRQGIFGFVHFNDPGARAPGDVAFKDIAMGLQWIKSNIEVFGGNPNNVTAFGQGIGAAYIRRIIQSPEIYSGLFQRVILHSDLGLLLPNRTAYNGNYVAMRMGSATCAKDMLAVNYLRSVSAQELSSASNDPFGRGISRVISPSKIAVYNARDLKPIASPIPVLCGYNSKEGLIEEIIQNDFQRISRELYENHIVRYVSPSSTASPQLLAEKTSEIRDYFYDRNTKEIELEPFQQMISDTHYNIGIFIVASHMAHIMGPENVYFYRFEASRSYNVVKSINDLRRFGACHGDELGYIFKTPCMQNIKKNSVENTIIKRMTKLWVQFAKTGNPNPVPPQKIIDVEWKPMTSVVPRDCYAISEILEMCPIPELDRIEFWQRMYASKFYMDPLPRPEPEKMAGKGKGKGKARRRRGAKTSTAVSSGSEGPKSDVEAGPSTSGTAGPRPLDPSVPGPSTSFS